MSRREGFTVPHDNLLKTIAPCYEIYFYFLLIKAPTLSTLHELTNQVALLKKQLSYGLNIKIDYHWKKPMYRGMLILDHPLMFSNSLIIHQVKTKKIITVTEVWKPGLN